MAEPVAPESRAKGETGPKTETFDAVGSEAAFERYRAAALAFDGPIRTVNVDVNLAVLNARTGVSWVLTKRAGLQGEPWLKWTAVETLSDLGDGLLFVSAQVDRYAPAPKEIRELRSRASELRTLLLMSAQALALNGWLPPAEVEQIRKGRGPIDGAEDCVALGAMFRERWPKIHDKVGFDRDTVEECSKVGTRLVQLLRPKGATEPTDRELAELAKLRDRFWSLFHHTWEWQVWRAGAVVAGRDVDEHVPALNSRVVARRAPVEEASQNGADEVPDVD